MDIQASSVLDEQGCLLSKTKSSQCCYSRYEEWGNSHRELRCGKGIATMTIGSYGPKSFGPSLVYASTRTRKMSNIVEDRGHNQFANGQGSRDLRISSDAAEWRLSSLKRSTMSRTPSLRRDFNANECNQTMEVVLRWKPAFR